MCRAIWLAVGLFFWISALAAGSQSRSDTQLPQLAVGTAETILSRSDRERLGLTTFAWSDSTLSVIDIGGTQMVYGTGGDPRSERCNGLVGLQTSGVADTAHPSMRPMFQPLLAAGRVAGCVAASPATTAAAGYRTPACQSDPACADETPFDNDYAALTSTVRLPNGLIVGFVHGEHQYWDGHGHQLGNASGMYSRIGLYVSRDGGRRFSRYSSQPVIAANIKFATVYQRGVDAAFDISGGAAVVTPSGMVYIYYSDQYDPLPASDPDTDLAATCGVCIAVASIPLRELDDAIGAGRMPIFKKFYRGHFDQPGLGGRFSPVIYPDRLLDPRAPLDETWIVWPSVGYAPAQQLYVMAYMSQWGGVRMRTSQDGLRDWSQGVFVSPHRPDDDPEGWTMTSAYPTIVAQGPDHRTIDGDFFLYFQSARWSESGFDWAHSAVMRRRVTLTPARLVHFKGFFAPPTAFLAYADGQSHYCTMSDERAVADIGVAAKEAETAAMIEPGELGWTNDGACAADHVRVRLPIRSIH